MCEDILCERRRGRSIAVSLLVIFALVLAAFPWAGPIRESASAMDLGHLPLSFVPNLGQAHGFVKFLVHSAKNSVFFTANDIVLLLQGAGGLPAVVDLHFIGANLNPTVVGADRLPGVVNNLKGADPAGWFRDLPTFGAIVYEDLYPGVDLRFDGVLGELKGTYTLAAGIDPTCIRWRHLGWVEVSVDEATGDLVITVAGPGPGSVTLVEGPPVVSQIIDGEEIPVEAGYVIHEDGSVGFELGDYDSAYPLIIDPTLTYSTYLGGSGLEDVEGIALDADGNMIVVGTTMSWDFPTIDAIDGTLDGEEDVYVTKINAAGDALLYSTYIGGSEDDEGNAVVVDGAGNVILAGATDSGNFPTVNAYQGTLQGMEDAFVAKLNADGDALIYSTYLGGSHIDEGAGLAVDADGRAVVVGTTFSTNFPTANAVQATHGGGGFAAGADAFVTKLTAAGDALVSSTYLGGSGVDAGVDVAVDGAGNAFVIGETRSTNFPTAAPLQGTLAGGLDLFVAKLNAAGDALLASTYLGGSQEDYAGAVATDESGQPTLVGHTLSTDFPTEAPLQATLAGEQDAFVTRLDAAGSALVYSTYLGGQGVDQGWGVAVNPAGEAFVTGDAASADFPVVDPIQTYRGESDAFFARLADDGTALVASTFLGGAAGDYGVDLAVDAADMAVLAGITFSDNFPTVNPLYDTYSGSGDAFIAKISGEPGPTPPPGPNFFGSTKTASRMTVMSGGTVDYTISLLNSGDESGMASVSDVVPAGLAYVEGSASGGGMYDPATRTLSWTDVTVAAGATVDLTYAVTATAEDPVVVINEATITTDDASFERVAAVLVLPAQDQGANLIFSHKRAAQPVVAGGETLMFTIELINSGSAPASVTVTDPLPAGLTYVEGSADDTGGDYDPGTGVLTWADVTVEAKSRETLTFEVTADEVTMPTVITNIATLSTDTQELERRALVAVSPATMPVPPGQAPVVEQVVIDEQDVLTDPDVTLTISATDDDEVTWMHIREWYLETEPVPHWAVVQTSEWLPYAAETTWTLHPASGVHFIGVWVADADYNVSWMTPDSLDYASLLLPGETVPTGGVLPYMVHYAAGEAVTAMLTSLSGDADLYVWYPGNFGLPNVTSTNATGMDSVSFTTPKDGPYLFLVYGYTAATYDLAITPGGVAEPHAPVSTGFASMTTKLDPKMALFFEPIFSQSGLDPVTGPTQLQPPHALFLPVVIH